MIKKLSFRWRIALIFTSATALLTAVIFAGIYLSTRATVLQTKNVALREECNHLLQTMSVTGRGFSFTTDEEWDEQEHQQAEINPTFLQVFSKDGALQRTSPNLGDFIFPVSPDRAGIFYTNITYNGGPVRIIQFPIRDSQDHVQGYMIIGMPFGASLEILTQLRHVLLIIFPIVVLLLFLMAYIVAGQSIKPVHRLINTANALSGEELSVRMAMPVNHDELYELTETLNRLFERIEASLKREQQFTSDVSHELRTPLAGIRGKLEVMMRKPRTTEEYRVFVDDCIRETDRLTSVIAQLLLLARCESGQEKLDWMHMDASVFLQSIINRLQPVTLERKTPIHLQVKSGKTIYTDRALAEMVVQNILENALKYADADTPITVNCTSDAFQLIVSVHNRGPYIPPAETERIFRRFYRSTESAASVKGSGLGLALVKRISHLIGVKLGVKSSEVDGTTFTVAFPVQPASEVLEA